jgi:maleylpyruvate isomerase
MRLHHGWRSSASWRVRWALALKRVSYDDIALDIRSGAHHGALAGVNPMHQVPILELDDGRVLTESVAIIEWLDETIAEPPLLPRDAWVRARVRERVQLINAGIHPLQNTIVRKAVADDEVGQNAWAARWIERGLAAYEEHLRAQPSRFSVGDTVTMADLYLVPQVRNAARFGADIGACTEVRRVYDACMQTPEAIATQPRE